MAEHNEHRKKVHKHFRHNKSGQSYQLLMTVHDVDTQTIQAVYCLNAMPQLKFTRPMNEFLERFTEGQRVD